MFQRIRSNLVASSNYEIVWRRCSRTGERGNFLFSFSEFLSTHTSTSTPEAQINKENHTAPTHMKIYTRTGDKGESSLYSGERRPKSDAIFEALGEIDELNSILGVAHEHCKNVPATNVSEQIPEIQSRLLDIGSVIATPPSTSSSVKIERVKFDGVAVDKLENWIDEMDEKLSPLKNFILPSGGLASAQLHVARSHCRRAERRVVSLTEQEYIDQNVLKYLNRLSDYLFTAARIAAAAAGEKEVIYKKS